MSIGDYTLQQFFKLCERYRTAARNLGTKEGQKEFIRLSIQVHIAKGDVPKRYWKYANIHRRCGNEF